TSTSGTYQLTSTASYPEVNVTAPLYVVSQLTSPDGTGGAYTQTYQYQNARADLLGRGFEGFQIVQFSDSRVGARVSRTTMATNFPWTGFIQERDVYQHDGATPISQTTNTRSSPATTLDSTTYNQRFLPYPTDSVTKSYEVGGPKNGQLITTRHTNYVANGTVPDAY